jgi:DNA replication protein DnaC
MVTTDTEKIKTLAQKLKLPVLADYQEYIESGESLEEGLIVLLQHQLEEKQRKSIERRIKKAKFPLLKTLDTFQFDDRLPYLKEKQVRELVSCEYIEEKRNVIAIGNSGTGKTHLITALGLKAIEKGYNVFFKRASELVIEMSEAKEEKQLGKYLKEINKCQALIIDELGYLSYDIQGASLLFQVFAERYETKSTLITTNLEFSKWMDFLGDPTLATAIIDRLAHKTIFLNMNGDSFRLKNADIALTDD